MGVDGVDKSFIFVGLVFLAIPCSASDEAIKVLLNKVEQAKAAYEKTTNHCNKISKENDLPILDKSKIKELGITRDEAVTAIYHLSVKNYYLCEKAALHEYSFLTGALKVAKKEAATNAKEELYPFIENLKYEANYLKMAKEKRVFFELSIKSLPYDFVKYIEKNGLSRY